MPQKAQKDEALEDALTAVESAKRKEQSANFITPLNVSKFPISTDKDKEASMLFTEIGKAGIRQQQRGMQDTAASEEMKYARAKRDLGGPRTPPYK